ncbi:MAG: CPBP family intramembrane metalloprotease [Methanomassiliicoccaceae archaeon]|nr:CPBP family intramembrane metalloprotease [Methanomassiliicoccaceae archaeon]
MSDDPHDRVPRNEKEFWDVFEEDTGYAEIEKGYGNEECDKCSESAYRGFSFCPKCGRPVVTRPANGVPAGSTHKNQKLANTVRIIGLFLMLNCAAMLFFEMYTVFWGMDGIAAGIEHYSLGVLFLVPSPVVLFWVSGIFADSYYLFLVMAVTLSFVFLLYKSYRGIALVLKENTEAADDIPLYSVATLFAATIAINLIFNLLVTAAGSTPATPGPPAEPWMDWYSLLNASVWEEVICRIVYIGVPITIIALLLKEKEAWKRLFGHFELDNAAAVFIVISSLIFAAAHISSWDIFKLFPTFVSGLALGYLFVKYGVYASIMFHFLVDYLSSVEWVLGEGDTATALLGLFLIVVVFLGIVFVIWYTARVIKFVRAKISERQHTL